MLYSRCWSIFNSIILFSKMSYDQRNIDTLIDLNDINKLCDDIRMILSEDDSKLTLGSKERELIRQAEQNLRKVKGTLI